MANPQIAILIPAFNEELTISDTITAFDFELKDALIAVIDNNSSDGTAAIATSALNKLSNNRGLILFERSKGKSHALRKGFRSIEADVYITCDADTTYDAKDIHKLISGIISDGYEMVVIDRHSKGSYSRHNERKFHEFGNKLIQKIVNFIYKSSLVDILSGYRAFSKNFVDSYPFTVDGFEIETDITLHALDKKLSIKEIPGGYSSRPQGSHSKLNTFKDGGRILRLIIRLIRYYKPVVFFNTISALCLFVAVLCGLSPIHDYLTSRFVKHVPMAILASSMVLIALMCLLTGLVLDAVNDTNKRVFSLSQAQRNRVR
jgi:glycosyltransferase involved in cell wall biosynthesis